MRVLLQGSNMLIYPRDQSSKCLRTIWKLHASEYQEVVNLSEGNCKNNFGK